MCWVESLLLWTVHTLCGLTLFICSTLQKILPLQLHGPSIMDLCYGTDQVQNTLNVYHLTFLFRSFSMHFRKGSIANCFSMQWNQKHAHACSALDFDFCVSFPRSFVLHMQKSRSLLLRTKSYQRFPHFKC